MSSPMEKEVTSCGKRRSSDNCCDEDSRSSCGSQGSDGKRQKQEPQQQKPQREALSPAEAHYICVDMSGSIRDGHLYSDFVSEDVRVLVEASDAPKTHFIMWGRKAKEVESMDALVAHLLDNRFAMGGNEPECFVEQFPRTACCIDLTVVTDGEIEDYSIQNARDLLKKRFTELRVRRLTLSYVNSRLDAMNMGLSVIFGDVVQGDLVVRIKDEDHPVQVIEVEALDSKVGVQEILDEHIQLDKTQAQMLRGVHHLSQCFSMADPQGKLAVRRQVREHMQRFIREHRNKQLSEQDERTLLDHAEDGEWYAAKEPFVGYVVPEGVKLVQAVCQKFLNECQHKGVMRISAYAPIVIQEDVAQDGDDAMEGDDKEGQQFDEDGDSETEDDEDEVLLDDITFRALGEDAVIALPCRVNRPTGKRDENYIDAAIGFDAKLFPDNLISLQTLLELCQSETGQAGPLRSSADSFGTNPFNRTPMSCVLLLPVQCSSLPAKRLEEIDRWNENMLSRYTRCGRYVPSLPLCLALILEPVLAEWKRNLADITDSEERARMSERVERVVAACRAYLAQQHTPATFKVGMAVVVEGTFRTAATLACRVLLAGCDPRLPIGVLTRFWTTLTETQARACWSALLPYSELKLSEEDTAFPLTEHLTLVALASGTEWKKSGRDAELRKRKGLEYSIGMFVKYLDHLFAGGCDAARLRHEEVFIRRDLFGVPFEEPLLCLHGVEPELCGGTVHGEIVLCQATGKPTLLNRLTLDMWYVRLAELRADQATRASYSFHRALWQLVRKRNAFPETVGDLVQFVCSRARSFYLRRGLRRVKEQVEMNELESGLLLPTQPCRQMLLDAVQVLATLDTLRSAVPGLTPNDYKKMLNQPRRVCEAGSCCAYIREACTSEQLSWINEHATFEQVGHLPRILCGELSYRSSISSTVN